MYHHLCVCQGIVTEQAENKSNFGMENIIVILVDGRVTDIKYNRLLPRR